MLEELKAARRSAGWSQRELADRIGVDAQAVKRLEKGVGSVSTLVAAMAALDFRLTGLGPGTTLAEQLRRRRRTRSLSIEEAASRAGLSRATVAHLEKGGGSVASLVSLLSALAPKARRRAQERSYWGDGRKADRDSRFTPPEFMDAIYEVFGEIDVDPCAHPLSPVRAARRIMPSEGGDGLTEDWGRGFAYVNPPYSELLTWLRRAHHQWASGNLDRVVCLVPVRTDSAWFHDTLSVDAHIYLLRGRVRFLDPRGLRQPTPFSLMLAAMGITEAHRRRFEHRVPGFWMPRRVVAEVDTAGMPGATLSAALSPEEGP